jgi:hypothetical protein
VADPRTCPICGSTKKPHEHQVERPLPVKAYGADPLASERRRIAVCPHCGEDLSVWAEQAAAPTGSGEALQRELRHIESAVVGLQVTVDDETARWEQNGVPMASAPVSWFEGTIALLNGIVRRLQTSAAEGPTDE